MHGMENIEKDLKLVLEVVNTMQAFWGVTPSRLADSDGDLGQTYFYYILQMEAVRFLETSVSIYQQPQRNIL
jgi:hypothetical protein